MAVSVSSTGAATATTSSRSRTWVHVPRKFTYFWLIISVTLVIWDSGYVLLRPRSMTGGDLHWIWSPYSLYATIDYVYGFPAMESKPRLGFTGAQTYMNVIETSMYITYLYLVLFNRQTVRQLGSDGRTMETVTGVVKGRTGATATLILFAALVMTWSKTVLYVFNEICSGYGYAGHNDLATLIPLYIVPNGSWIVFPFYLLLNIGKEIIDGLALATGEDETELKKLK